MHTNPSFAPVLFFVACILIAGALLWLCTRRKKPQSLMPRLVDSGQFKIYHPSAEERAVDYELARMMQQASVDPLVDAGAAAVQGRLAHVSTLSTDGYACMDVLQKIVQELGGDRETCLAIASFGNSHPDNGVLLELEHRLKQLRIRNHGGAYGN